jgi:hypothetical protein
VSQFDAAFCAVRTKRTTAPCRLWLRPVESDVMNRGLDFQFDEIGYWSELKLEIVSKYALAYSGILSNQLVLASTLPRLRETLSPVAL